MSDWQMSVKEKVFIKLDGIHGPSLVSLDDICLVTTNVEEGTVIQLRNTLYHPVKQTVEEVAERIKSARRIQR